MKIKRLTTVVVLNYEAESVNELKTSFIEAVEDYLETCKELEKPTIKRKLL